MRVRGIAEQRGATERPPRKRVAVDHRVLEDLVGRGDDARHVEPVEPPVARTARRSARGRRRWFQSAVSAMPSGARRSAMKFTRVRPCCASGPERVGDELLLAVAGHDHGAAVEEGRRERRAAPEHEPVPRRRALVGVGLRPQGGVDAVGARSPRRPRARARRPRHPRTAPCRSSRRARRPMARQPSRIASGPRRRRTASASSELELAAMHRQLRPAVAGLGAARLAPDELAEPVDVRQAAGRARRSRPPRRRAPARSAPAPHAGGG